MEPVVNVVLPIFAIIGAGYLAGRVGILGEQATDALNNFVYWVALPALLFKAMATVDISVIFDWDYIGAYVGSVFFVYILSFAVARLFFRASTPESALFSMSSIFANTGYMGIPLALVAFGPNGTLPAVIATVSQTILFMALPICIIEMALKSPNGLPYALKGTAKSLATNPLVIAPVVGICYSALHLTLPTPVETFTVVLGNAAGPCALFALGLFLVGKPIGAGKSEVGAMVCLKLIMHPVAAWYLGTQVFDVRDDWLPILVVMAALPTGALVFVLAQRYQIYVQRASTATLFSTILAVLTVSIVFGMDL